MNAPYYIEKLGLEKHIEGGAFRETYRSPLLLKKEQLPAEFAGNRVAATGIYFLLEAGQFSAFHRIASDEMWHFYDGDTLSIYEIEPNGNLIVHRLGRQLEKAEVFQCVITAGNWFASRCERAGGFSLVGCTVAPGFDFEDFELAKRAALTARYPMHGTLISELTYE